ncbi:MAG: hypothetical protein WBC93_03535, partial [Sulfitobacter sp.]
SFAQQMTSLRSRAEAGGRRFKRKMNDPSFIKQFCFVYCLHFIWWSKISAPEKTNAQNGCSGRFVVCCERTWFLV